MLLTLNPKKIITTYFSKKKWFSIFSDVIFVVLIILIIIPSTRIEVTSFFIKLTSFPPSLMDQGDRFKVSEETNSWLLYDMKGNPVKYSELNKKPVFLNLWATWCPPCVAEMPGIYDLFKKYGNEVNFVIISNETTNKIREFSSSKSMDGLPFYMSNSVPDDFFSKSIPMTFIIDNTGIVVMDKKGAARWNSEKVKRLLDELIDSKL